MNFATIASVTACAVVVSAGSASAALTTENPGYVSGSTLFEARMRLDQGNSQTWKAAFWEGGQLGGQTGVVNGSPWVDGLAYDFTLNYTASTGAAEITIFSLNGGDRVAADTIQLATGNSVAGFRYYAGSRSGIGTTSLTGLTADIDGDVVSLDDIGTTINNGWNITSNFFFTANDVEQVSISGQITYDWIDSVSNGDFDLQGERFKAGFYFVEANGTEVPAPGAAVLAGVAGVAALRRKRA